MTLAFFSPLPPAKSGIADYSEALLRSLHSLADVDVFDRRPDSFDPARYDAIVYQIGNNGHHAFVYEMALEHPGIAVLHEANLHHLIADITIKRGDWDAYMTEVEYDGGAEALAFAQRVRTLEVGPDYAGVPMLRRLLARSKGVVVHSAHMRIELTQRGYNGPIGVIPHGAWLPPGDRMGYRHRLGIDAFSPLVGIFGFLKPYKRITESLHAFRRVVRVEPRSRMILAGEAHPEFPVQARIESLGLGPYVRLLGFVPIEDFTGYLSACDIVLNLRYPTVGESSGTLLRALGLGKAVLVSNVGSFSEYPDDICFKVPVDQNEEDLLFEYLNLLVSRPDLAGAMGERARRWVEQECNWNRVARLYLDFAAAVAEGRTWFPEPAVAHPEPEPPRESQTVTDAPETQSRSAMAEYLLQWAESDASREYMLIHLARFEKTLAITPPGDASRAILEMGAYMQITPALQAKLGYGHVRGCYYGPAGMVDRKAVRSVSGAQFECDVDLFNAEKDRFPYSDGAFQAVLCCELLEHLLSDPMHMMSEINRILAEDGRLVLTTPNIVALRAVSAVLQGYHPGLFPAYVRPAPPGEEGEARHTREYTPKEIEMLLLDSGFEVELLDTGSFRGDPKPEHGWVEALMEHYRLPTHLRGEGIYAVGKKTGRVRSRYPGWLYIGGE